MINIKVKEGFGILGVVFGIGTAIWAAFQTKKANDSAAKIGLALEDVSKKTPIDIQQAFLDKAVERAVDREVKKAVQDSSKFVSSQIRSDMDSMIRKDVDTAYNDIRGSVEDKVTAAVDDIDIDAMKEGIRRKVESKMVQEMWSTLGIGKLFGGSTSSVTDLSGLKDVLNTLPSYERSNVLTRYFNSLRS